MPYLRHMTEQAVGQRIIPQFTVGDRLRKARELTGLDQGAFAREIDQSRQTVSNYETGATKPRLITLKAWALRTGVDLAWITDGTANSPTQDWPRGLDLGLPWLDSDQQPAGYLADVVQLREAA